jgi:epoxide hydrolase 4
MIEKYFVNLPNGTSLACHAAGSKDAPSLVFLHGFPEAAFVWDETLLYFASLGYRCIAPNLRGFGHSSSPTDVSQYRAKHLVQDIAQLIALESPGQPLHALVAHDWGGAIAWNLANQQPELMRRLVIINSPHPGTFLRDLKSNPTQQSASSYMNFLCRPDAESLLAEHDFRRLFEFFTRLGAIDGKYPWLDEATQAQYREVWALGLTGGCNYYRASPLKPPVDEKSPIHGIELPVESLKVDLPTMVIWGMQDIALPPNLLKGLEVYIPRMQLQIVHDATHWIIHEQPARVHRHIADFLT